MRDLVLFNMWGPYRQQRIAEHEFYVGEARRRLLDPFTDDAMRVDADRYVEEWLQRMGRWFDPERDDPTDHFDQAHDEQIAFYLRLDELRKTTRLSIIAGMYHGWEKQLRDWLTTEIRHLGPAVHLATELWRRPIDEIFDFMESWRWPLREAPYFEDLRVCNLVVNVYKHGNGRSLDELRHAAPALAGYISDKPEFLRSALDHTDLTVEDEDLNRFSDAIVAFWHAVPENTFQSAILDEPAWVRRALDKDARGKGD